MNETKMISFEEWKEFSRDATFYESFQAARQGMIPADRAVEMTRVEYIGNSSWKLSIPGEDPKIYDFDGVNFILRKPKWIPNNGDPCLFDDDGEARAAFIHGGYLFARGLMVADWKQTMRVKPFDPAKIGKPWGEL